MIPSETYATEVISLAHLGTQSFSTIGGNSAYTYSTYKGLEAVAKADCHEVSPLDYIFSTTKPKSICRRKRPRTTVKSRQ
jgi:hypothetical protein